MVWFKVDDKLHDHRKARAAGKAAMGVWVLAGSWSGDNLTDGFIPASVLPRWGTRADAKKLVDAGFWRPDEQDGEPGWRFHDWTESNPDAASVLTKREAEGEGGRRGNHVRWHAKKGIVVPDCQFCTTENGSGTRSATRSGQGDSGANPPEPGPSRNAAAAASRAAAAPVDNSGTGLDLPPAVEILRARLEAHRLIVRWDKLTTNDLDEITNLIELHGDGPLVTAALAKYRPNAPAAFAQAWLGHWRALPTPGTTLHAVPEAKCTEPGHQGTVRRCNECASEQKAAR